jgi:phospholipid/cholesterol/gamma-HCH transport system permease protein
MAVVNSNSHQSEGLVSSCLTFVGEFVTLTADAFKRLVTSKLELKELLNQMAFVGVNSAPIVALTGFFSGAVLSLYISTFLFKYGATSFVGATVVLSMVREIGPVLAGVTAAARCGSAMAAQIGTMKVTEQIDALKMLSVHPTNYLVVPRVLASILMLPILGLTCSWAGAFAGWLVAGTEGVNSSVYIQSVSQFMKPNDITSGLIKTPFFGLIIAIVSCQQGLRTENGAVGAGRSTTNAVVISMVLVYVANFFLARWLP